MKKITLITAVTLLLFTGCLNLDDRYYDRIPADMFPENDAQLAVITVPVYSPLIELLDWGGWWFCQELTTDEVVIPVRDTDWDDGGKWVALYKHEWTNTTEAITGMWGRFYRGIFEANKLIELWTPSAGTPAVDLALAKMKVMRGFYYYLLMDNYGDVPYVTSFANAPQFPYRNHRDSIWHFIVRDVAPVIRHLEVGGSKYSPSKGMAYMLMAKLYMNSEVYTGTPRWDIAEKYIDSLINLNAYSLESNPLGPFVTNNQNSPEIIFAIGFDEDFNKGFNLHMRTLHYNSNLTFNMPVGPWNGMAVTKQHFDTYSNTDRRKNGFLVGQQYSYDGTPIADPGAGGAPLVFDPYIPALRMDGSFSKIQIRMSGARIVKFEIKMGAKDNLSNDFPIFRYADALLMKAEVLLRQGKGGAVDYVNPIRQRALTDYSPLSSITLDELLAERGREMFFEAHRRQDLIRFGKFNNAWWEKPASSPDRKIFPIPQWAIDANPNLDGDIINDPQ